MHFNDKKLIKGIFVTFNHFSCLADILGQIKTTQTILKIIFEEVAHIEQKNVTQL